MSDEQQPRAFVRFEHPTDIKIINERRIPAGSFMFLGTATPKEDEGNKSSPLILWAHFSFDPRGQDYPHRQGQEFTERFLRCIMRTQADDFLSGHRIRWSDRIGQVAVVVPYHTSRPLPPQLRQVVACLLPCERARPHPAGPAPGRWGAAGEPWGAERAYSARAVRHFASIVHLRDPQTARAVGGREEVSFLGAMRLASEEHVETQAHRARQRIRSHWRDLWLVRNQLHRVRQLQQQQQQQQPQPALDVASYADVGEETDDVADEYSSEWEGVSC